MPINGRLFSIVNPIVMGRIFHRKSDVFASRCSSWANDGTLEQTHFFAFETTPETGDIWSWDKNEGICSPSKRNNVCLVQSPSNTFCFSSSVRGTFDGINIAIRTRRRKALIQRIAIGDKTDEALLIRYSRTAVFCFRWVKRHRTQRYGSFYIFGGKQKFRCGAWKCFTHWLITMTRNRAIDRIRSKGFRERQQRDA